MSMGLSGCLDLCSLAAKVLLLAEIRVINALIDFTSSVANPTDGFRNGLPGERANRDFPIFKLLML